MYRQTLAQIKILSKLTYQKKITMTRKFTPKENPQCKYAHIGSANLDLFTLLNKLADLNLEELFINESFSLLFTAHILHPACHGRVS